MCRDGKYITILCYADCQGNSYKYIEMLDI